MRTEIEYKTPLTISNSPSERCWMVNMGKIVLQKVHVNGMVLGDFQVLKLQEWKSKSILTNGWIEGFQHSLAIVLIPIMIKYNRRKI